MHIDKKYYCNDTIHRSITNSTKQGTLSCGFLFKPNSSYTEKNLIFEHYGALYLLNGSGTYIDQNGQSWPLYPGCYVQRLPEVAHTTIVDPTGDWLEFFVCFGSNTYNTLLDLNLVTDSPVIYPTLTKALFEKCLYLLNCFKKFSDDKIPTLYLFTQELVTYFFSTAKVQHMSSKNHILMKKACELLCQMSPSILSPLEVSTLLNIGYESFRKRFKSTYLVSPTTYQLNHRINYSKTLLLDTQKSINEIALLCNFSDAFSYSKAFKHRCGLSPNLFRKNHLAL